MCLTLQYPDQTLKAIIMIITALSDHILEAIVAITLTDIHGQTLRVKVKLLTAVPDLTLRATNVVVHGAGGGQFV